MMFPIVPGRISFIVTHESQMSQMDFDLPDLDISSTHSLFDEDMYMFQQACLMVAKQMNASEFDSYEMQQVLTAVCVNVSSVQEQSVWIDEEDSFLALFPNDPFTSFMN